VSLVAVVAVALKTGERATCDYFLHITFHDRAALLTFAFLFFTLHS